MCKPVDIENYKSPYGPGPNHCNEIAMPGSEMHTEFLILRDKDGNPISIPPAGTVINKESPELGDVSTLFSERSINNVIQVTPEQAKYLESLEMTEATIQLENKTLRVEVDPADPDPTATVETVQQVYARGQRPEFVQLDELPFIKPEEEIGTRGCPVGPKGEPGPVGPGRSPTGELIGKHRTKRKKSKPKSSHLPNMSNRVVKAALGAAILGKLGAIQQKHTDAAKREVLATNTLSSVIETVAGKELPDYQRRLMDLNQARAEGSLKPEIAEALGSVTPADTLLTQVS